MTSTSPPKNQSNQSSNPPFASFFSMNTDRTSSLSPPSSSDNHPASLKNNQSPRMASAGQYASTGASHSTTTSRSSLSPGYSGFYGASEGISSHTTPSYDVDLPFDLSSPKGNELEDIDESMLMEDPNAMMMHMGSHATEMLDDNRQFDFSMNDKTPTEPKSSQSQSQTQRPYHYQRQGGATGQSQQKHQNSTSSAGTATNSNNVFLPSPSATNSAHSPLSPRQFASPEAMNITMSSPIVKVEDHDLTGEEPARTRKRTDDHHATLNRVLPPGGDDNEDQMRGRRARAPDDEVPSINDTEVTLRDMESRQHVVDWLQRSFAPGETVVGESGRKTTGLTVDTSSGRLRSRSVGDWRSLEPERVPQSAEQVFGDGNAQPQTTEYPFTEGTPRAVGDVLFEDSSEESDDGLGSGDNANDSDGIDDVVIPEEEYQLMPNGIRNEYDPEASASAMMDPLANAPPLPEDLEMEEAAEAYPDPKRFYSTKAQPWFDPPSGLSYADRKYGRSMNQPQTAQAAIELWQRANRNIETASRVATFGSIAGRRRLSAGEVEGLFKRMSFGKEEKLDVVKRPGAGAQGTSDRTPSLFELPKNVLKRFASSGSDHRTQLPSRVFGSLSGLGTSGGSFSSEAKNVSRKESLKEKAAGAPSRIKSLTRKGSKSKKKGDTPRVNTSSAIAGMVKPLVGVGSAASAAAAGGRTSPPRNENVKFGVVSGLIQKANAVASAAGGAATTSPPHHGHGHGHGIRHGSKDSLSVPPMHQEEESSADEDAPHDPVTRTPSIPPRVERIVDPIHPSRSGFAKHCRQLNPQLPQRLVDRIAIEQVKRYKKLLESYKKHSNIVQGQGSCGNGNRCAALVTSAGGFGDFGAGANAFTNPDAPIEYDSDESTGEGIGAGESNVAAAQFPPGVPVPPVNRLPAEFECTICFKMKKFNKPSDWTKHVHEDVQPFTCTFPECTEPKSFKRKADWVRHENEKHRHLEWWACSLPDCQHKCYRKDNFVQHLVREHKMPEPKVKAAKAAAAAAAKSTPKKGSRKKEDDKEAEINKVWRIVEECHRETDKLPTSEPCRFCGLKCSTWKKLTVHLARHMEEISLPVLKLITDDAVLSPLSARGNSTTTSPIGLINSAGTVSDQIHFGNISLQDRTTGFPELDMMVTAHQRQQEEHERAAQNLMHTPPQHYISSESVSPVQSVHSHHSTGIYPQQYPGIYGGVGGAMQSLDAAINLQPYNQTAIENLHAQFSGAGPQHDPNMLVGHPFPGYHDPNTMGTAANMAGPQYVTAPGVWDNHGQQQQGQQPAQGQNDESDLYVDWNQAGHGGQYQ